MCSSDLEKLLDIERRVDKFQARREAAKNALEARKAAAAKKAAPKKPKTPKKSTAAK
mgnify:CR=1 FL=1